MWQLFKDCALNKEGGFVLKTSLTKLGVIRNYIFEIVQYKTKVFIKC